MTNAEDYVNNMLVGVPGTYLKEVVVTAEATRQYNTDRNGNFAVYRVPKALIPEVLMRLAALGFSIGD